MNKVCNILVATAEKGGSKGGRVSKKREEKEGTDHCDLELPGSGS